MPSTNITIKKVEFEDILPAWEKLWPGRENEPFSAMLRKGGYDSHIRDNYKYTCIAAYDWDNGGKLVGVNVGHRSAKNEYRTRGLWVDPESRGQGIAGMLFERLEQQAQWEGCRWLWSLPRLSSLPAYMKAGYEPFGEPMKADYEQNVRAQKDLSIVCTSVYSITDAPIDNDYYLESVEYYDNGGYLLGQNEEVRNNKLHITQHWVNDFYCTKFITDISERATFHPEVIKKGDIKSPIHVL